MAKGPPSRVTISRVPQSGVMAKTSPLSVATRVGEAGLPVHRHGSGGAADFGHAGDGGGREVNHGHAARLLRGDEGDLGKGRGRGQEGREGGPDHSRLPNFAAKASRPA